MQSLLAKGPKDLPSDIGGLLRLLYLAVLVASADGSIDENELEVFHRATGVTDEFSRKQISVTQAALSRDANIASKQLRKISNSINHTDRLPVFTLLVHIACSDGILSSEEDKLLRRIAKIFELDSKYLDNILSETDTFKTVTVERASKRSGSETIPPPPQQQPAAFQLDMNRIAALTVETAEVVSILSKALEEEKAEVTGETEATSEIPSHTPDWMEDLDARYHSGLLRLLSEPSPDLPAIAKDYHLMPGDLLDGINTWADEALGDFLLEIGDNGIVNISRELIPTT